MSNKIKRFYSRVETAPVKSGFTVELDGRPIRSPGQQVMHLPQQKMADELAREWHQQEEFIDPAVMPVMQFASMVNDNIIPDPENARTEILKYANSDLLCYRVGEPQALVERQKKLWDPVLQRFESEYGIDFLTSTGILYVEQRREAMDRFWSLIKPLERYELGAVHLVTVMSGSAVLAIALQKNWMSAEMVWELAHLDEDFQAEQWGRDEEAVERRQRRYVEFSAAILCLGSNSGHSDSANS